MITDIFACVCAYTHTHTENITVQLNIPGFLLLLATRYAYKHNYIVNIHVFLHIWICMNTPAHSTMLLLICTCIPPFMLYAATYYHPCPCKIRHLQFHRVRYEVLHGHGPHNICSYPHIYIHTWFIFILHVFYICTGMHYADTSNCTLNVWSQIKPWLCRVWLWASCVHILR